MLEGEGGSGKTFISRILLAEARLKGKIALAVASSGLASLLLPGGRTGHYTFKLPVLQPKESTVCNYSLNSNHANLLRESNFIIWDEISMVDRFLIEAVDRMFRDIMKTPNLPFGGKVSIILD